MNRTATKLAIRPIRRLTAGLALGIALAAGAPTDAYAQTYNSEGWTILQPSEDTRFVFVSSSEGNDQNSGRSPAQAVRTIDRAKQLMRDGFPDWMLLKRGDVWNEGFGTWTTSGRSATERCVIASYGDSDERPLLNISQSAGIVSRYQRDVSHVAIVGIHFEGQRADTSPTGVRWLSTGKDLLVEDCLISGFKDNLVIQGQGDGFSDVIVRRNIIVDSWSTGGHSQGLFLSKSVNILIEENIFDRNGWNPAVQGADPTIFNQNVYIQYGTENVSFIGNLSSRAAGSGAQLRNGGIAKHNLFYANPMPLRFGFSSSDGPAIASGEVKYNTVVGGPLSNPDGSSYGIWIERLDGVEVMHNVITSNQHGNVNVWGFSLHDYARNATITNNVVFGWNNAEDQGGIFLRSPAQGHQNVLLKENLWISTSSSNTLFDISHTNGFAFENNLFANISSSDKVFKLLGRGWVDFDEWSTNNSVNGDQIQELNLVDPGRNLRDYAQHLGFTDEIAFLQAARQLSRRNWRPELLGEAASAWIRAGYQIQPN